MKIPRKAGIPLETKMRAPPHENLEHDSILQGPFSFGNYKSC